MAAPPPLCQRENDGKMIIMLLDWPFLFCAHSLVGIWRKCVVCLTGWLLIPTLHAAWLRRFTSYFMFFVRLPAGDEWNVMIHFRSLQMNLWEIITSRRVIEEVVINWIDTRRLRMYPPLRNFVTSRATVMLPCQTAIQCAYEEDANSRRIDDALNGAASHDSVIHVGDNTFRTLPIAIRRQ